MPDFTKGKWIYSPPTNEVYPMFGTNAVGGQNMTAVALVYKEQDAMLIAKAPEMYELLREELIPTSDYGGTLSFAREAKIRKVLDYIDGKEGD